MYNEPREINKPPSKFSGQPENLWQIFQQTIKENLRRSDVAAENIELVENHVERWKSCLEMYQDVDNSSPGMINVLRSRIFNYRESLMSYDMILHEHVGKVEAKDEDLGKNSVLLASILQGAKFSQQALRSTERQLATFKERANLAEGKLLESSTELSKAMAELQSIKQQYSNIDQSTHTYQIFDELKDLRGELAIERTMLNHERNQKKHLEQELRNTKDGTQSYLEELTSKLEQFQRTYYKKRIEWTKRFEVLDKELRQKETDLAVSARENKGLNLEIRKLENITLNRKDMLKLKDIRCEHLENTINEIRGQIQWLHEELKKESSKGDLLESRNANERHAIGPATTKETLTFQQMYIFQTVVDKATAVLENDILIDKLKNLEASSDFLLPRSSRNSFDYTDIDDGSQDATLKTDTTVSDDMEEQQDHSYNSNHGTTTETSISERKGEISSAAVDSRSKTVTVNKIREALAYKENDDEKFHVPYGETCSLATIKEESQRKVWDGTARFQFEGSVKFISQLTQLENSLGYSSVQMNDVLEKCKEVIDRTASENKRPLSASLQGIFSAVRQIKLASVEDQALLGDVKRHLKSMDIFHERLQIQSSRQLQKIESLRQNKKDLSSEKQTFSSSIRGHPQESSDGLPAITSKAKIYKELIKSLNDQINDSKSHCEQIRNVLSSALREVGSPNLSAADRNLQKMISKQIIRESESIVEVLNDVMRELKGAERFVHPDQQTIAKLRAKCDWMQKQKILIVAPNSNTNMDPNSEAFMHTKSFGEVLVDLDKKLQASRSHAIYCTDVLGKSLEKLEGRESIDKNIPAKRLAKEIRLNIQAILDIQEEVRDVLSASERFIHPDQARLDKLIKENVEIKEKLVQKTSAELRLKGELSAAKEVLQMRETNRDNFVQVSSSDQKPSTPEERQTKGISSKNFADMRKDLLSRVQSIWGHCDVISEGVLVDIGHGGLSQEQKDLQKKVTDDINKSLESVMSILEDIKVDFEKAKRYIHPDHQTLNELESRYQKFKGQQYMLEKENLELKKQINELKSTVDQSRKSYIRARRTLSRGGSLIGADYTALFCASPSKENGTMPTQNEMTYNEVIQSLASELDRAKNQYEVIKLLTKKLWQNPTTQMEKEILQTQNQLATCCSNGTKALIRVEQGLTKAYSYVHPDHVTTSTVKTNLKRTERKLKIASVEKDRLKIALTAAQQLLKEKDNEIEEIKQALMEDGTFDPNITNVTQEGHVDMRATRINTFEEVIGKLRSHLVRAMDNCAHATGAERKAEFRFREFIGGVNSNVKNALLILSHLGAFVHADHKRVSELKVLCINLKKRWQSSLVTMEKFKSAISLAENKKKRGTADLRESTYRPAKLNIRGPLKRTLKQFRRDDGRAMIAYPKTNLTFQDMKKDLAEMNPIVDKAKKQCLIIRDVLVTALRDVGMAELSQSEKHLQANIGDQIEKLASNVAKALTDVAEEFVFMVEHFPEQEGHPSIQKTVKNSTYSKDDDFIKFRDIQQKRAKTTALLRDENNSQFDITGEDSSKADEFSSINFANRREEYLVVAYELQGIVSNAINNCISIKESAKESLELMWNKDILENIDLIKRGTETIIQKTSEIQEPLGNVKEELHLAGQLLVENEWLIEDKWKKHVAAEKQIEELNNVVEKYQKKITKDEMVRLNLEKELEKTKAMLSRRASQILHMEEAIRLEQSRSEPRQASSDNFVLNSQETSSRSTEKYEVEDVSTIEEALERLEDVKGHLENQVQENSRNGRMISTNNANNEIFELRNRCIRLEQQIEEQNLRAILDRTDHTIGNRPRAMRKGEGSGYQDPLDIKDVTEHKTSAKTKDGFEEASQQIGNVRRSDSSAKRSVSVGLSQVDDEKREIGHDKLPNTGSSGMLVVSKTLRIVRFLQKQEWSHSTIEILQELENELNMVQKILIAKNEMIEDLQKKIGVEKDTIDVLTKVLENQNSVVPRYPFREDDNGGDDKLISKKDYDEEDDEALGALTHSNTTRSESDLRDPNVKAPFTSNLNSQLNSKGESQDVEERRRSLAKTRRLLELEHRRLSMTSPPTRLEAETRRRSSISAEQYSQSNRMNSTHKWDHKLVSVLSRTNSAEDGVEEEEIPQPTPANSPTASPISSPTAVVQKIAGAVVSKEVPIKDEVKTNHVVAKQWKHIYKLQRKLKNLEINSRKEIQILKQQMALYNLQERPIKEKSIQSEVLAWKEKYWKVAYDEQKRGERIDELQEELEETRNRFLEATTKKSSYEPEHRAEQQGVSNMNDDEFEAVIQLIETVSESHSHELMELDRANDAVVGELQSKVQQIVNEKSEIELELAERTKELNQIANHQQTICHLQTQLEETQSSLQTKQNEVSEMKKAHGKTLSELKMSKLQFIKQSVIEIERLKSVIRSYNSKNRNPISSPTSSWLAGWV